MSRESVFAALCEGLEKRGYSVASVFTDSTGHMETCAHNQGGHGLHFWTDGDAVAIYDASARRDLMILGTSDDACVAATLDEIVLPAGNLATVNAVPDDDLPF